MYTKEDTEEKQEIQPDFNEYPDSLPLLKHIPGYGTCDAHIKCVKIFNKDKEVAKTFHPNEPLMVQVVVDSEVASKSRIRMSFRDENDIDCLGTIHDFNLKKGFQKIELNFIPIQLTSGKYKIVILLYDESFMHPYFNGFYGYFDIINISSSYMKGTYTPYCWAYPKVAITDGV